MDQVQRQIRAFDQRLNAKSLNKKLISSSPLVFAAVPFAIGIVLQNFIKAKALWWLAIAVIITGIVLITILRKKSISLVILAYITAVGFACLGAIRTINYYAIPPNDITRLVRHLPSLATIQGTVITEPYISRPDKSSVASIRFTDPPSGFYLKVTGALTNNGFVEAAGTTKVYCREPVLGIKPGYRIKMDCWLDSFRPPTNPGQFNKAQYLARRNVQLAATVNSSDLITILRKAPPGKFSALRYRLKSLAAVNLLGAESSDDQNSALLSALLLGVRSDISDATMNTFRRTGLLHFISLSGLHMGILIATIWALCRAAGLLNKTRAVVCIIVTLVFIMVVPPRAPTLRAAVIAIVFCVGFLFQKKPNAVNSLALAATILLLVRPTQIFEAGFQLSFVTVLGILLFTDRLSNMLLSFLRLNKADDIIGSFFPFRRLAKTGARYAILLFAIGLAAWFAGMPVLLYHFESITPLAPIWTIIAFPFVWAILVLGFIKIPLTILLPTAGTLLFTVLANLAKSLMAIVKCLSYVWPNEIIVGHVPLWPILLYYAIILYAFMPHMQERIKFLKWLIAAGVLTLILPASFIFINNRFRNDLYLTCLDVSHGQSIILQLPPNKNLIFDAGSKNINHAAQQIIMPYMRYNGIDDIDAAVISHEDIDHYNAIDQLVSQKYISQIYAGDKMLADSPKYSALSLFKNALAKHQTPLELMPTKLNFSKDANFKLIWPTDNVDLKELTDNNRSLVTLIECSGSNILICSDIEAQAQQRIMQMYPNLRVDVMIAPHHGSLRTMNIAFLRQLSPSIIICSCSEAESKKISVAIPYKKAQWHFTGLNGAVTVRISDAGSVSLDTFVKKTIPVH